MPLHCVLNYHCTNVDILKLFFQSGIPYDQLFHSKDVHKPSGVIDDGQFTEVKGHINQKVVKGLVILEADRQLNIDRQFNPGQVLNLSFVSLNPG